MPTSVKLAKCHFPEVLLDQFVVTRVDTVVVIADCGEEHQAHPTACPAEDNDSDVDWSSGVLPKKRRVDAPVSRASLGLLESRVMFHREVVEDILGDGGLSDDGASGRRASGLILRRRCRRELAHHFRRRQWRHASDGRDAFKQSSFNIKLHSIE